MSGDVSGAPVTATKATPAAGATAATTPAARKSAQSPLIVGAIGGLLTLAAISLVVMKSDFSFKSGGDPAQPTLTLLDQRDLGAAAATLAPASATALVEDAQRCRVPLASLTIDKGTAAAGSVIRIKSGSYTSPYFTVTEGVQRIAVPYPAPYGSGSGTIVIEGTATGSVVGLTPARIMNDLPGLQNIPVVWRATSPCS